MRWFVAALAGLAILLAGCGTPQRTITGDEAMTQLGGRLAETLHRLQTSVNFDKTDSELSPEACTKPLQGSGYTGQVKAHIAYTARGVAPEVASRSLDALERYWNEQSANPNRSTDHLVAYPDGSAFYVNYDPERGEFTIDGVSDCVWRNGTPGPGDNP